MAHWIFCDIKWHQFGETWADKVTVSSTVYELVTGKVTHAHVSECFLLSNINHKLLNHREWKNGIPVQGLLWGTIPLPLLKTVFYKSKPIEAVFDICLHLTSLQSMTPTFKNLIILLNLILQYWHVDFLQMFCTWPATDNFVLLFYVHYFICYL